MEKIEIKLSQPNDQDDEKFIRLLQPVDWSIFIDRVLSVREKRSLSELVEAFLEGK